jgi:hypothetical protein
MKNIVLPPKLVSATVSENRDFAVKAGRILPLKTSLYIVFFGIVWIAFVSIFIFSFLVPIFQGEEVHFESNGVPMVASSDNLGPIIIPAILIIVLFLIGIGILLWGICSIFRQGGYFVGTPTRLVYLQNGRIRSIDWQQFSGDIEISGNAQKGDILLRMRTGKMVESKGGSNKYVPNTIYISEIPNVFEVEQICRKRIKENSSASTITENNTLL